jgi:hypothetical protein
MNVELLLKVKAAILAHPETYIQSQFCGTAFCIGGHAVAIARPDVWKSLVLHDDAGTINSIAKYLLDMDEEAYDSMTDVARYWPEPFCDNYWAAKNDPIARAKVAASIIDHYIGVGHETV